MSTPRVRVGTWGRTARLLLLAGWVVLAAHLAGGCQPAAVRRGPQAVRIAGSDTMAPLVLRWSAGYMQAQPHVAVYSCGGGSGAGVEALVSGAADVCASSRPLMAAEVKRLQEVHGVLPVSVLTARDALSIYVHPDNPVRALTLAQVQGIFLGEIQRWSQVGGLDTTIVVVQRQPNSGTHHFLRSHVLLDAPFGRATRTVASTQAVVAAVAATVGAVGYGGYAYGGDAVVHCAIDGVTPAPEHVRSGAYPISRYLYLYTAGTPQGAVSHFIDWVLSDAGQRVVGEVGYVPLWDVD